MPTQKTNSSEQLNDLSGGWIPTSDPITFISSDSPSYLVSVNYNATGTYSPGMKFQLTHLSQTKNFIITQVTFTGSATRLNLYGGTDFTLNITGAITSPLYSWQNSPYGFPTSETKWSQEVTSTANNVTGSPVGGTIYNIGNISLDVPIGAWRLSFASVTWVDIPAAGQYSVQGGLGTTNNTLDAELRYYFVASGSTVVAHGGGTEKPILVASKTTYYLNATTGSAGATNLRIRGDIVQSTIRAVCAYL